MNYRRGNNNDLEKIRQLAIVSWAQFKTELTKENWDTLSNILTDKNTYLKLLQESQCIVCESNNQDIIGMAFLVPKGNPTDIYDTNWAYIRFVSVNPKFAGQGIGRQLTLKCIELAKQNKEQFVALHTSEMMTNAIQIYESLGFKILREIDERLGKKYWLYMLELE